MSGVSALLLILMSTACTRAQMTFKTTASVKPTEWDYTAPQGEALTWFAAETPLSRDTPTSPKSFLTNPGGRIVDIIQASNGTAEIRGYAPSTDSFSSDTTRVQLSTESCNLQAACTASTLAQNGPACNMYPVDMTFAGNAVGLVTHRDSAVLVVICSALVKGLCSPGIEGCVYVDGPQNATVKYAAELPSGLHTRYKLQIGWPVDYTGPIIFSVECPLQDIMGNSLVVPLKALSFNAQGYVPMTATAYMSSQ